MTSEDGIVTTKYTVTAELSGTYDFETWVLGVEGQKPEMTFYEVAGGWSSSNTGAQLLKAMSFTDRYVVTETDDAHSGKSAARIETVYSKGANFFGMLVPTVTTGTLFQGKFITDPKNTLNSTKVFRIVRSLLHSKVFINILQAKSSIVANLLLLVTKLS